MKRLNTQLVRVLDSVVPQHGGLTVADGERELSELGFDSLALVSLFIELESEFALTPRELMSCLHRRCTLAELIALCTDREALGAVA